MKAINDPSPTICAVLPVGQKFAMCREGTRGTFVKVTVLGKHQRDIVCGVHVSGIPGKIHEITFSVSSITTKVILHRILKQHLAELKMYADISNV